MKRTVPLIITTTVGFVLIVAYFIPVTQWLGEFAAISFDILAAIAFILGGGNLLKTHLKKINNREAGWGYSGITIGSFLLMLVIGLGKFGVPPAVDQEHFGNTFASLSLSQFPVSQQARVQGSVPIRADGTALPPSVRMQISEDKASGMIVFRGWMRSNQKQDLLGYQDELRWQATVERLFASAQPPASLTGKVAFYAESGFLSFAGAMQPEDKQALLGMSDDEAWRTAIEQISQQSRRTTRVALEQLPPGVSIPDSLAGSVSFDAAAKELAIVGPMSVAQRQALVNQFPIARPLQDDRRRALRDELESQGAPLTAAQATAFDRTLDGIWTVAQLTTALNAAGQQQQVDKTASEMLAEQEAGNLDIVPTKQVGTVAVLNDAQQALLERFADQPAFTAGELADELGAAGDFTGPQQAALDAFLGKIPTQGELKKALCIALLRTGPLTVRQRNFLVAEKRTETAWQTKVNELFHKAHTTKYPWSGDYGTQGGAFWWMYEYVFKPLTATMFSMLAFYVASAAFRAFRAKNIEASLLLGTAFTILLGRTFAGVWLTSWLPDEVAGLRIENLTVFIMSVFVTAGNRAIMIGIALGIAATSLKVLLGIDRSYLGQQEE